MSKDWGDLYNVYVASGLDHGNAAYHADITYVSNSAEDRREVIRAKDREIEQLRGLLKPFAEYAAKREEKPFSGMGDVIHGIHMGTEHAAELKYSDCLAAMRALEQEK